MTLEHSRQSWGGSHSRVIKDFWRQQLPTVCEVCGEIIRPSDDWNVGHKESRGSAIARGRPDLVYDITNTRPEHRRCSDAGGAAGIAAKARAEARAELGAPPEPPRSASPAGPAWRTRRGPFLGRGAETAIGAQSRARASDDRPGPETPPIPWESLVDRPWLADVAVIPEDGAPPRAMSPPHPDAVGSYGEQAEKWAEAELGLVLRWWQSLALRKILEHDAAGRLVWRQVLASTPRRSGKSILTMTLACWRLVHGELLGEERQTIVHSGQDLQVVGEVMRLGQAWAKRNDFVVRRKNGQEAIEAGESRWLMRSQLAVFGYEIGLGIVDEAWAVPSSVVDDGLEPAQLHRASPQLLLVSTAHRRATSLMRRRLEAALAGLVEEDYTSLLLWWAAPGGAPIGDPETWRKASPFWTGQQLELISGRWERAMRGELDPQADDPDPAEGFKAQYLNLWPPPGAMPAARETRAVPDEVWEATRAEPPGRPVGAAIESTFAGGLAVGMAYPDGRGHVVSAVQVPTMTDAVDQVLASGAVSLVVGKSLLGDPLLVEGFPVPVEARSSTPRQAVVELRRLLRDGVLRHDDSALLDDQVTALFVAEGVDGPRVRSGCRVDAVKAVLWAVEAAGQVPEAPHIW